MTSIYSCNTCGSNPKSTYSWCNEGCGRDYNQMSDIQVSNEAFAIYVESFTLASNLPHALRRARIAEAFMIAQTGGQALK